MNRRVHAGPWIPELESTLVHNIARGRTRDPLAETWLLVPSLDVKRRLKRRMADEGNCFNVKLVLFPDLARAILAFSTNQPAEPAVVGYCASRVLLQGIVTRTLTQNSWFGDVRTRGGFIEALESTLETLDHAGIEPGMVRALSRSGKPGVSARKLAELADIQESWISTLGKTGYESAAGLLRRAAAHAASFPPRSLHVYGFYDLNGVQRRLVEELCRDRDLTFYFPSVGAGESGYSQPLRKWLLERGFGFTEAAAPGLPESTEMFSAAGELREIEEVGRRVLRLLAAGTRPDQIAIVYRTADPYAGMLRAVLRRAGVAAEFHDRPSIWELRPARALTHLVDAALSGFGRREVMNFIDIALPMHPRHGADSVALSCAWDTLTIDAGITRGRAEWLPRLKRLADSNDHHLKSDSRQIGVFAGEIEHLFDSIDHFMAARSWRDLTERLLSAAEKWVAPGPQRDDLFECVAGLGELDRTGEEATLALFRTALEDLLARTRVHAEPVQQAALHVGDVLSVRGLGFEHLFVVGLTEKVFPRGVQPDPVLLDRERELLGQDPAWLPLRAATSDEEIFLFALLKAASKHVVLSCSRMEPAKARPRLPSIFLLQAASNWGAEPVDYAELESRMERIPMDLMAAATALGTRTPGQLTPPGEFAVRFDSALDQSEFDRMIVAMAAGSGRFERLAGICGASRTLRRAITADLAQWHERRFTTYDGSIESAAALEILKKSLPRERIYSASRLEKYARCPFCYFLEELLGVESIDSPEDQDGPDALSRGSLIHQILQEFLGAHTGADLRSLDRETLRAELTALAGSRFDEFEKCEVTGLPLSWAIERAAILDDLLLWLDFELDRNDGIVTEKVEWSFGFSYGDETAAEALKLKLPGGGEAALRGRIDRVDISPDGRRVRVVDYKTGRVPDHYEGGLDGGRRLQLASYLLAIQQAFPRLKAGTAEYLHLKNGVTALPLVVTDFNALRKELCAVVGTLVEGIESGRFFAVPDKNGLCRYCYRTICGAGITNRFEKKRDDPRIESFLALREEA